MQKLIIVTLMTIGAGAMTAQTENQRKWNEHDYAHFKETLRLNGCPINYTFPYTAIGGSLFPTLIPYSKEMKRCVNLAAIISDAIDKQKETQRKDEQDRMARELHEEQMKRLQLEREIMEEQKAQLKQERALLKKRKEALEQAKREWEAHIAAEKEAAKAKRGI